MSETSGKVWPCGHVYWSGGGWMHAGFVISEAWKICPICKAIRPEEAKDDPKKTLQKRNENEKFED